MRALVTGASGFVGSHLVRDLSQSGWEVGAVLRPSSESDGVRDVSEILIYDGSVESLVNVIKTYRPEVVFHLASLFKGEHTTEEISPMIDANLKFGVHLLEAMKLNGVSRLVNAGTSWQHFGGGGYNPVNLYAATKEAFEAMIRYYVETAGLKAVTLKLYDTYGPQDARPKLFNLLKKLSGDQKRLEMSAGEQEIDLLYITDVISAFKRAAELTQDGSGHTEYGLFSGNPVQLRRLVEYVEQALGQSLPIDWGKRPYRKREVFKVWKSGQSLPDWSPQVSLEQGIKKCFEIN